MRTLPALAWMALIFFLSSQEGVPQPWGLKTFLMPIIAHLVLYGILAILLLLALQRDGKLTRAVIVSAVVGAALYGVTDEFHQSFVPGRDASVFDLIVNTIGATVAVVLWIRLRRRLPLVLAR
jgi:VanZ family protein